MHVRCVDDQKANPMPCLECPHLPKECVARSLSLEYAGVDYLGALNFQVFQSNCRERGLGLLVHLLYYKGRPYRIG